MGASVIIGLIWEKTPGYVKWPVSIGFFLFLIPLKIRDEFTGIIQKEVHAVVIPMKEKRDLELLRLQDDVQQIKQDTREIKLILMKR